MIEPSDYAWCGLRIRSVVALPWPAAPGVGRPDIEITAGPVAGPAIAAGAGTAVAVDGTALALAIRGVGRFLAEDGQRVWIDAPATSRPEDVRLYLCGSMMGAICLQRGMLPLHASAVIRGSGCVAFAGQSGEGKSTLVAHLARAGWPLLADDVCVIDPGGAAVWPGTARVKLTREALVSLDRGTRSLAHAGGTREKYHLEVNGPAASGGSVPLRVFYVLRRGDRIAIEPLAGLDAVDAVGGHTYREEFVLPLGRGKVWLAQVAKLTRRIAVRRLIRPAGFEHMAAVMDALAADIEEHT